MREQRALGPAVKLLGNVLINMRYEFASRQLGVCPQCREDFRLALQAVLNDPVDGTIGVVDKFPMAGQQGCRSQGLDAFE